jgi:hypothetical protein
MMKEDVAYNVSPERAFEITRNTIGTPEKGTWLSDKGTFTDILGEVDSNQKFSVGFFASKSQTRASYFQARLLAKAYGTEANRFMNGFRISTLERVSLFKARIPVAGEGNAMFVENAGLPFGGPEIIIKPPLSNNP